MKRIIVFLILGLLILNSCKKTSQTDSSSYFILNGDKRDLGTIPSATITMDNSAYNNPNEWQLALGIKSACYKIAGLNNDEFEVYIDIWDNKLLKTEYNLVPGYSGGGSTAGPSGTASIGMRPFAIGGSGLDFFDALSGTIKITKDKSGNLNSVEFSNIPLSPLISRNTYLASGRILISH